MTDQAEIAERVRRLEVVAKQWDRCSSNAPPATYRMASSEDVYRSYAAACRDEAIRLLGELGKTDVVEGGAR